ncbi:MAG TPA: type II secretion system protein [Thermoanaerobacterales bacterium]|nr:type II secretion system protein [Thermoanaerobacterales bacterium]
MKSVENCSGMTLIELIVSIGIMAIILTVIFAFLTAGIKSLILADKQMEVQQNARIAFDWISRDLKIAKDYEIVAEDKIKIIPYEGTVMTYYKSGKQLILERNKGHNPIANYIEYLKFEKMPDTTVKIDLIVEKDSYKVELSTKVKPPIKLGEDL